MTGTALGCYNFELMINGKESTRQLYGVNDYNHFFKFSLIIILLSLQYVRRTSPGIFSNFSLILWTFPLFANDCTSCFANVCYKLTATVVAAVMDLRHIYERSWLLSSGCEMIRVLVIQVIHGNHECMCTDSGNISGFACLVVPYGFLCVTGSWWNHLRKSYFVISAGHIVSWFVFATAIWTMHQRT